MSIYRIPLHELTNIINPLDGVAWGVAAISVEEINSAIAEGKTCEKSWQDLQAANLPRDLHRTFHLMRIAHLVATDPTDPVEHTIFLCVSKEKTWFYDGNHRAAAAIARGDAHIDLKMGSSRQRYVSRHRISGNLLQGIGNSEFSSPQNRPVFGASI